jgi:cohesin loading factor subunit SCC2
VFGLLNTTWALLTSDSTFKQIPAPLESTGDTLNLTSGLSPFSRLIYERANIAVSYPSSRTPQTPSHNGHLTPTTAKRASPVVKKSETPRPQSSSSAYKAVNKQSHNFNFEIPIPAKVPRPVTANVVDSIAPSATLLNPTPATISSIPATLNNAPIQVPTVNPMIAEPLPPVITQTAPPILTSALATPMTPVEAAHVIPPEHLGSNTSPGIFTIELSAPAHFNKNEYQVVADVVEAPDNLSARKKVNTQHDEIYGGLDHRKRADVAFDELRRVFQDIFEAEANVDAQSTMNPLVVMTIDQEPTLTPSAHKRVQQVLRKAIELRCIMHAPLDDLIRMQKLCDGALRQANNLDMKLDDSFGEVEIETWAHMLPDVDIGLKAARTAVQMMDSGRQDRQLFSEDVIQSAVDIFRKVLDGIVVPVAELRSSGPTESTFKKIQPHQESIAAIFTSCHRLLALLVSITSAVDLSETAVNTLEFAASRLIFVSNSHMEGKSVLGQQKFDSLRLAAMDMLCQIYVAKPKQRQGILDGILTSLEKLPVGKQSARQFKLADGLSIQPVSALIMRLVQASAGKSSEPKLKTRDGLVGNLEKEDEDELNADEPGDSSLAGVPVATISSEDRAAVQHATAIQELQSVAEPLMETARANSNYIINFLVGRALKSSKSGETPYRNLLDLFVEDLTICLDSPDWPAAELLLRVLMAVCFRLIEKEKQAAPSKNLALEVLGILSATIAKLRSHVRKAGSAFDSSDPDELVGYLSNLASVVLDEKSRPDALTEWAGPFRAALEYLQERCAEDKHLAGAVAFVIAEWAEKVCQAYDAYDDEDVARDQEFGRLAYRLRMMIGDRKWLTQEFSFKAVAPNQAKLAHCIILIRSQLSSHFSRILSYLLQSMSSDQAMVRSKSLKSVNQLMETDPSILDGASSVIANIVECCNDSSTQVRDSALGLLGNAITLRPALESAMVPTVIDRFVDVGVGVRKRAVKLAKELYLRNKNRAHRSLIANALLGRVVRDTDEAVKELARQTIEDVWISPFVHGEDSAAYKIALDDHVALVVQTVKTCGAQDRKILDKIFQMVLSPDAKLAKSNFEVCKRLVAGMFDVVDKPDSDDPSVPTARDALVVLQILAKAEPRLFTFEQIQLLKPHLSALARDEDMAVSGAVMAIYRSVLPQVSTVHEVFLDDVSHTLTQSLTRIHHSLLEDTTPCLWTVMVKLGRENRIAKILKSALKGLGGGLRQPNPNTNHLHRFASLIGYIGKNCDLAPQLSILKSDLPFTPSPDATYPKLLIEAVLPLASPSRPHESRRCGLKVMGLICQGWPRMFVDKSVYTAFQAAFDERDRLLELEVMTSLKKFLTTEERRSEDAAAAAKATKAGEDAREKKRELTVMGGTSYDDVASATTQRFLEHFKRLALATLTEHAFLATELLVTINRQGLVHPKETGIVLITLETSPDSKVAELAYQEHKSLHGKHETVLEREYAKAIQTAYGYQRDIVTDPRGATVAEEPRSGGPRPFMAKLHLLMNVLKDSKSKNRQKLIEKMCSLVDFEPNKLDTADEIPKHVGFSRFVIENLAFFDYITAGELYSAVSQMEKLVHRTGAAIAQAIESEIFRVRMDVEPSFQLLPLDGEAPGPPPRPSVDVARLRQLTAGSMIMMCLWEARTYLRRLYGLKRDKVKPPTKDLVRTPIRVPGVSGDKFWEDSAAIMNALQSEASMMEQCRIFVDLLNVDKEFKVADDEEDLEGEEPTTPSADEDEADGRGRKRKASTTPGGRKKRARSSSQLRKRGRPRKNPFPQDEDAEGELDDGEWA